MALIVFLRGINVGEHRTLRPSMLAKELGTCDLVNVGAEGTFVIRKPGMPTKFLSELRRNLPLDAVVAFCDSSDLIRLEKDNPFRRGHYTERKKSYAKLDILNGNIQRNWWKRRRNNRISD